MVKSSGSKKSKEDLNKQEVRDVLNKVEQNHRGRGRTPAERRASYARYYELKKKVIELESRNFQHLVLFPASDKDTNKKKFYNMGGNSAIIYVYEIAPRIGKSNATLRFDMDNKGGGTFHSGICSIVNVDFLEKELTKIGCKRLPPTKGYEDLIIFKLNRVYTKSEIKEMLKQYQNDLDELNKILYAEVLHPDIHRLIIDLKKIVPSKVKNMDATYRGVVGMRLVDTLMNLIQIYTQMAHGDRDEYEAGKQMLLEIDMLFAEISMMVELKQWEISSAMRVATMAARTRQLIKGKIINKHEANQ